MLPRRHGAGGPSSRGGRSGARPAARACFPSPSYGDVSLLVYTPPGYFTPGDQRRFPVVYWLHGSGGTHLQLMDTLAALPVAGAGAAAKLDALIAAGEIPPMLMVAMRPPAAAGRIPTSG